jgi:hypothetical protein
MNTDTDLAHRLTDAIAKLRQYGVPTNECVVETVELLAEINTGIVGGQSCSNLSTRIDRAKACLDKLLSEYRP